MNTSVTSPVRDRPTVDTSSFSRFFELGGQIQTIMFLKDVAIAGAFLMLVANGAGSLSLDHRRAR